MDKNPLFVFIGDLRIVYHFEFLNINDPGTLRNSSKKADKKGDRKFLYTK